MIARNNAFGMKPMDPTVYRGRRQVHLMGNLTLAREIVLLEDAKNLTIKAVKFHGATTYTTSEIIFPIPPFAIWNSAELLRKSFTNPEPDAGIFRGD